MAEIPPDAGASAPKDYRPEFTEYLGKPETRERANMVTRTVVSGMNSQMAREGQPMTEAHYRAAVTSMDRGDSLCGFLKAENEHVIHSTGDGCVYTAGKKFHEHVVKPMKDCEPSRTGT